MAYIGRQQTSSAFLKLDDISSQFNSSTTTFNLTLGGEAFFAGNPYSLLISLGGVIQEPIASFTILENQINFASAPRAGANFFCVVLATTIYHHFNHSQLVGEQPLTVWIYMEGQWQLKIVQELFIQ